MGLVTETMVLTLGITFFACLPMFFSQIRKHSKLLFLIGTGALFGLCFFDLLPDVFEMGGKSSLYVIGVVWALYSLVHLFHLGHHEHDHSDLPLESPKAFYLFFSSLMTHCFASGMLLTLSHELSAKIASTVFMALVAHKGYEALMLSSVLIKQNLSKLAKICMVGAYSISLPLGVAITFLLKGNLSQEIAMVISSIAVGTLMGCLIFDFMIPCFRQLKTRRLEAVWMVLGLLLTQIVIKGL